ncbi:hypothetical protein TWF730_009965 [Orbilia blumenaviensis]|uniref:Uncharacterized protein n=1 Tax=Orbilia blumenaviensis TaxID=1796055 RepID=A0AAV9UWH4_9PEZI
MQIGILYFIILFNLTRAQWSYRLIYTPITRDVVSWLTVPTSHIPKSCASLSRRFTHRNARNPGPASADSQLRTLAGIAIHQPLATDNRGNPKMARYIGFWGSYYCKSLPKFVVHFRPETNTLQSVSFQNFDRFIPGFNASDYNIWGWGEIPQGDLIFSSVPAGAAAFRESGAHTWTGNYIVVEDMVGVGPRSILHGEAPANPGGRPTHWHIDIGETLQSALTRPKDGIYRQIEDDIVSYRYYGPLAPEATILREGGNPTDDLRELYRYQDQGGRGMIRMEEEPGLMPAYNMDEQKKAILRAYVQVHGAEAALYALQQMIDEYRFQHYIRLLTPELLEAARRDGIMQLQVGERADRLAQNHILRETIKRPLEDREAFLAESRAGLQRERDTGRNIVLLLVNEIQDLNNPGGRNGNVLGNYGIMPTGNRLWGNFEVQEAPLGNIQGTGLQMLGPGLESNNGLQGRINIGAQYPAQQLQGPNPLSSNRESIENREMERLSENNSVLGLEAGDGLNLILAPDYQDEHDETVTNEQPNLESLVESDPVAAEREAEANAVPENGFIDMETRSFVDSKVEDLVKSEYSELFRSEGLDNNYDSSSEPDFEEPFSLDTIPEEPFDRMAEESLDRIPEESFEQIPVNQIFEEPQSTILEEIPLNTELEVEDNAIIPEQNPPLQNAEEDQPRIVLDVLEDEPEEEPIRFSTSFGRDQYRAEAPPDDSPETLRRTTTHGRMDFRQWLESRPGQALPRLISDGIIPEVPQVNNEEEERIVPPE